MTGQELTVYHLIATGGGGILATLGLVWRLWIAPAQKRAVDFAAWKAEVNARLSQGESAFARHKDRDDEIVKRLDRIEERLRHIEVKVGGTE